MHKHKTFGLLVCAAVAGCDYGTIPGAGWAKVVGPLYEASANALGPSFLPALVGVDVLFEGVYLLVEVLMPFRTSIVEHTGAVGRWVVLFGWRVWLRIWEFWW